MVSILLKGTGIWFVIVIAAILNGTFREKVLVPVIGAEMALPLSGILLAVLVFLVAFMLVSSIGSSETKVYIFLGLLWVILTLSFEFLFGHFIAGRSWHEIMQVFNVKKGDLFIVVLAITGVSPWLAAKARGIL
jgi:ABC-type transport system involved in multi-copper enzyme maturation permease subunit